MKFIPESQADASPALFPGKGLSMHRWLNLVLFLLCIFSWLTLMQLKRDQPRREKEATDRLTRTISISLAEPVAISRINADDSRTPLFPLITGKVMDADASFIFQRMLDFHSDLLRFQLSEAGKGSRQEPKPATWSLVGEATAAAADQTISIYQTEDGGIGFGGHGFFLKSSRGPESPLSKYVIKGIIE